MFLRLIREPSVQGTTFGSLYLNGHWECWTLEDEIRERPYVPVSQWKVAGQTAIPAGVYPVTVTMSSRFQVPLPLIQDVQGFSGVRIHAGNSIHDTEGCVLVGLDRSDRRILRSRVALERLMAKLGTGHHLLSIENPSNLIARNVEQI